MPSRDWNFSGVPDSTKRKQELRTIARTAGQVAGFMRDANPKVRAAAKILNRYIPKGKSSLERKLGTNRRTVSSQMPALTLRRNKVIVKPAEGQSLTISKTNKINIGGPNQITSLPKYIDPLWTRHVFSITRADRSIVADGQGNRLLKTVNDNELPLHVYDLTMLPLVNSSQSYYAGEFLQNGNWQAFDDQPAPIDAESGTGTTEVFKRVTTWLHHKSKIRILLYGRQKQSTTYQIMFFRAKSEEACPLQENIAATAHDANVQRTIWFKRLAKYTTNPIYIGHNAATFRGDKNTDIEVLQTFTYTIKEQLSSEDAINKLNVNFTAYINKIKQHVHNQQITPLDGDITGGVPIGSGHAYMNATKSVRPTQRLYMAIMATGYETSLEANYEPPSYDFSIQNHASASSIPGWPT